MKNNLTVSEKNHKGSAQRGNGQMHQFKFPEEQKKQENAPTRPRDRRQLWALRLQGNAVSHSKLGMSL